MVAGDTFVEGGREGGSRGCGWELRLLLPRRNTDLRFIPGRRGGGRIDVWGFWCDKLVFMEMEVGGCGIWLG